MNTHALSTSSPVIELRQYTLHPGKRDALIDLFELEFIESQEATGMRLMGLYRDHDDSDRFVWLRGFTGMPQRAAALAAFYDGPVWARHRDTANATMMDSDNVLLLRPARPDSGILLSGCNRAIKGSTEIPPGMVAVHLCALTQPASESLIEEFNSRLAPLLRGAGAHILGSYVSEHAINTFPRLAVRTGENLFIWFELFDDRKAHARHLASLASTTAWAVAIAQWNRHLLLPTQPLRLEPTPRSSVHASRPM